MRSEGMKGLVRGRKIRTTTPGKNWVRAGDLLNRQFRTHAPNLAWVRGAIFFKQSLLYILAPVLAISLLQLSIVTMTRSLEDILNPRLRGA